MSKKLLVFCVLVLGLATNTLAQVPASLDVGGPAAAGSASVDPGTGAYTIQGAGNDVWGTWDQFHYVFRPLAGDGSGVARIVSQDTTHEWSKVGVMIRETLDGNSKHAAIHMTGTHGVETVWREQTGGASQSAASEIALPIYVKIERIGDVINTYMTFNPAFWIPQQSLNIPMKTNVYIGMYVCSHIGDTLATGVFDSVDLTAPAFPAAWAVQPADGLKVSDLSGLTISWQPGDTAASHNVHFGTESPPPLAVNQTETAYDTGALEGGKTYYYRIDEVEADGTTVHAGEEQSFSTYREGTGSILREVWEGIGGASLNDLYNNANWPTNPSWSDERAQMDAPTNFADNFGSRIHGWLLPETSGDYTFWESADDDCDLFLSTSESPFDAVRIAYHRGWTSSQQWDKYAEQNSANVVGPVSLEAGQMYYISVVYKEGGGGDNVAVAWEGPDSPSRSVIDGYYLMPFANLWAWGPSPADGATGVGMTPTLSWQPAVDAVSYEVYVDDALVASTADTSVEVGPFDLASSHTWRVDVVTNSPARTGATWSFTVSDNRVIDDFESYDAVPEGVAPQMPIGALTAQAPPEQAVIGGDYTIPGYTVEPVEPSDDALVARYTFDADASDSSGNGFDGTLIGDAKVEDGILKLDGDGDCVDIGNNPIFNPGDASFTISARVNMRSWGGNWGNVIIGKRGEGGVGWQLRRFGGDPRFSFTTRGMGNDDYPRSNIEPTMNEWHDVVAIRDGDKKYLYIDGVLDSTAEINTNPVNPCDHNVYMGARANGDNSGPEAFLDGDIDSVTLWGRVLTEGEIRGISGLDPKVVDPVYVPPMYGPMRLHLEFEGDLADSSGNAKDGTAVGTVAFDTDPDMGQVLSLPGGDNQYVAVPPIGLSGKDPTTIACWAKADNTNIPNWTLVFGFTGNAGGGGGNGSHFNIGSLGGPGGIGAHVWGWEESIFDDYEGLEWHHYAMTYDGTTIAYYGDGVPTDTDIGKSNVRDLSARADRVHVGSRITQASSFPGKVDDARVYDYAMSDAEIRYLAGLGDKAVYGPMRLHLDFEADADDVSGNGHEASLRGDASVADGVLNLDGDDFVDYGKPDTLPTGKGPWSLCGWGKTESVAGGWAWIAAFGNPTTGGAMFMGRNADDLVGGGYGDDLWINDFWAIGDWHHICVTYDGSTAAMYADGKLLTASARNWNLGNYYARIGRQVNNANEFWNGQIDDVRIYEYALTDAQIAGLAGATAANPISDTWSDLGMLDFSLAAGTMQMNTYALPGLPYYVGEVGRALPFADLTAGGGKALSTWVRGDPANIASVMYMSVADADGQSADALYDGDLTNGEWQEWNVDMAAELAGVDVTNAADIAIGLAGLDGGVVADSLNIDNIRVYTSRCMPDIVKPAADINNDCVVNADDLRMLLPYWNYVAGGPGVWYEYYPEPPWIFGNDIQNAPFDTTTPRKIGIVNNFDIGIREQNDRFGFRFTGLITVPADGDYTFYTSSDDGSFLDIGDTRVVENYGWHGMQWREGTITLTAGAHPITVAMFEDGGGEGLEVEYAGPGIDRQPIPDDVLSLHPLPADAPDLNGDGDVGWADVILMLRQWLDEELWP